MHGNTPEAPPADTLHEVTAHDRQQAARDAYRQSVADGRRPLTGVELGRMFDRSPRWGTSRIAEVRSEDIPRRNGNTTTNPTPSIRNGSDITQTASNSNGSLPIGNPNGGQGRHENIRPAAGAPAADGNGIHADDASLPIGSNTATPRPPRGNRNGATPSQEADRHQPHPQPTPTPPPDDAPTVTPGVRRITTVAVLAVALVAGVASYDHQRVLADIAGESWRAYLLPLSVDGLIVAASMAMLVRRRAGEPAGLLAWCALLLGLTASLAANVVAADPDLVDPVLVSRVVAAWPPVALGISFELSLQQLRSRSTRRPNQ
jgi:hypothetical protein